MKIWRRLFALKWLMYTRLAEIHLEWQIGLYCVIPLLFENRKVLILRVGDRINIWLSGFEVVINKPWYLFPISYSNITKRIRTLIELASDMKWLREEIKTWCMNHKDQTPFCPLALPSCASYSKSYFLHWIIRQLPNLVLRFVPF